MRLAAALLLLLVVAVAFGQVAPLNPQPTVVLTPPTTPQGGDVLAPHLYDWYFSGGYLVAKTPTGIPIKQISAWTMFRATALPARIVGGIFSWWGIIVTKCGSPIIPFDFFSVGPVAGTNPPQIRIETHSDNVQLPDLYIPFGLGDWNNVTVLWNVAALSRVTYVNSTQYVNGPSYNPCGVSSDVFVPQNQLRLGIHDSYYYGYVSFFYATLTTQFSPSWVVTAKPWVFLDPTWYNDAYIDLSGNGYNAVVAQQPVSRVDAQKKWVWVVRGLAPPNVVLLRFWPSGTAVVFKNGSAVLVDFLPGAVRTASGMVDNATLSPADAANIAYFVVPYPTQLAAFAATPTARWLAGLSIGGEEYIGTATLNVPAGTAGLTISALVYIPDADNYWYYYTGTWGGLYFFTFENPSRYSLFRVWDPSGNEYSLGYTYPSPGWYLVTMVVNNSTKTMSIFINGVNMTSRTAAFKAYSGSVQIFTMSGARNSAFRNYRGSPLLAYLRIYSCAALASWVRAEAQGLENYEYPCTKLLHVSSSRWPNPVVAGSVSLSPLVVPVRVVAGHLFQGAGGTSMLPVGVSQDVSILVTFWGATQAMTLWGHGYTLSLGVGSLSLCRSNACASRQIPAASTSPATYSISVTNGNVVINGTAAGTVSAASANAAPSVAVASTMATFAVSQIYVKNSTGNGAVQLDFTVWPPIDGAYTGAVTTPMAPIAKAYFSPTSAYYPVWVGGAASSSSPFTLYTPVGEVYWVRPRSLCGSQVGSAYVASGVYYAWTDGSATSRILDAYIPVLNKTRPYDACVTPAWRFSQGSGSLSLSGGVWTASVSSAPATLVLVYPAVLPAGTYTYRGPASASFVDSAGRTVASCSGSPCSMSVKYTQFGYLMLTYTYSATGTYSIYADLTYAPPPAVDKPPQWPPYGCNASLVFFGRPPWQYTDSARSVVNGVLQNAPAVLNWWAYPTQAQYVQSQETKAYYLSPSFYALLNTTHLRYADAQWSSAQGVTLTAAGLRDLSPFSPLRGGLCTAALYVNATSGWYVAAVSPPSAGATVLRSDGQVASVWSDRKLNSTVVVVGQVSPSTPQPVDRAVSLIVQSTPFYLYTWDTSLVSVSSLYHAWRNTLLVLQYIPSPYTFTAKLSNLDPGTYAIVLSYPGTTKQIYARLVTIPSKDMSVDVQVNIPGIGNYTFTIYKTWSNSPLYVNTTVLYPGAVVEYFVPVVRVFTIGVGTTRDILPPLPSFSTNYVQGPMTVVFAMAAAALVIYLLIVYKDLALSLVVAGVVTAAVGALIGIVAVAGMGIIMVAVGLGLAIQNR